MTKSGALAGATARGVGHGLERVAELATLEGGCTRDAALAFFDRCPALTCEEMLGAWRGSGMPTGHPMDGLLEATGWHGKRFDGVEDIHPLLFDGPRGGVLDVDPARLPMTLAMRAKPLVDSRIGRRLMPLAMPAMRTSKPTARLRMMTYRGVVTATMSYDARPINDHFRRVDDDTMLGAMDLRGIPPFFFVLRREI